MLGNFCGGMGYLPIQPSLQQTLQQSLNPMYIGAPPLPSILPPLPTTTTPAPSGDEQDQQAGDP